MSDEVRLSLRAVVPTDGSYDCVNEYYSLREWIVDAHRTYVCNPVARTYALEVDDE
jgi:hypothetical protein